MIALAPCPLCSEGQLGFRVCADGETLVCVCETCGHVWMHPSRLEPGQAEDPLDPGFARRHPALSLRPSRWATEEQVRAYGWEPYLLKPGDL